jgi:xylulokinase
VVILTVDLGTTVTKADLWDGSGLVAHGQAELATKHPGPDRAEQDPATWWPAVVDAAAQARQAAPAAWAATTVIGLCGARQTLVGVAADATPTGPALLWSDRRAGAEAEQLGRALGGDEAARQRTGQYLRATSVAAKLAWLGAHDPRQAAEARWMLAPRDLLVWQLTGTVATDPTLASASGCYDRAGRPVDQLVGGWTDRLAPVHASGEVVGGLTTPAADALRLRPDTPVVIGAGDRACEVVGCGASASRPMVSWGTAANVSRPGWAPVGEIPSGLVATRTPDPRAEDPVGWQLEGGLSAAGSLLAWLSGLTGRSVDDLVASARPRPPGAGGLVVLPWLEGARAPWWRDRAGAAVLGLRTGTDAADLARGVLEGVAAEVARVLEAMGATEATAGSPTARSGAGPDRISDHPHGGHTSDPKGLSEEHVRNEPNPRNGLEGLALSGRGATTPAWVEIVAAVTGLPVAARPGGQSAARGAALLTAAAVGHELALDDLAPVVDEHVPDPALVERYRQLAAAGTDAARRLIDFEGPEPAQP